MEICFLVFPSVHLKLPGLTISWCRNDAWKVQVFGYQEVSAVVVENVFMV